jgi:hypothetical protein
MSSATAGVAAVSMQVLRSLVSLPRKELVLFISEGNVFCCTSATICEILSLAVAGCYIYRNLNGETVSYAVTSLQGNCTHSI